MDQDQLHNLVKWLLERGYIQPRLTSTLSHSFLTLQQIQACVVQSGVINATQFEDLIQQLKHSAQSNITQHSEQHNPQQSANFTSPNAKISAQQSNTKAEDKHFGRYQVRSELGRGGMGVVYEGHDPSLQRRVAIKSFFLESAPEPIAIERFRREAQSLAQLSAPGIAAIYDFDLGHNPPYIVMEFIDAPNLHEWLSKNSKLSSLQAIRMFRPLLKALAVVHDNGILHRDFKPANILVPSLEQPVLTDFGIALPQYLDEETLTQSGALIGTPHYAAPELLDRSGEQELGPPVDIFAVGVSLYYALTKELPFESTSQLGVMKKILSGEFAPILTVNPEVDPELANICERCMQTEASERFENASQLEHSLLEVENSLIANARKSSSSLVLQLLFVIAVIVAIIAVLAGFQNSQKVKDTQTKNQIITAKLELAQQSRILQLRLLQIQRSIDSAYHLLESENFDNAELSFVDARNSLLKLPDEFRSEVLQQAATKTHGTNETQTLQQLTSALIRSAEYGLQCLAEQSPLIRTLRNRETRNAQVAEHFVPSHKESSVFLVEEQKIIEFYIGQKRKANIIWNLPQQAKVTELEFNGQDLFVSFNSNAGTQILAVNPKTKSQRTLWKHKDTNAPVKGLNTINNDKLIGFIHQRTVHLIDSELNQSQSYSIDLLLTEARRQNASLRAQTTIDIIDLSLQRIGNRYEILCALDNSLILFFYVNVQSLKPENDQLNTRIVPSGADLRRAWWNAAEGSPRAVYFANQAGEVFYFGLERGQKFKLTLEAPSPIISLDHHRPSGLTAFTTEAGRLLVFDQNLLQIQDCYVGLTSSIRYGENPELLWVQSKQLLRQYRGQKSFQCFGNQPATFGKQGEVFCTQLYKAQDNRILARILNSQFSGAFETRTAYTPRPDSKIAGVRYRHIVYDLVYLDFNQRRQLLVLSDSYGRDDPIQSQLQLCEFDDLGRLSQVKTEEFQDLKRVHALSHDTLLLYRKSDDGVHHKKSVGLFEFKGELPNPKTVKWLEAHQREISQMQSSRNGQMCLFLCDDGLASLWQVNAKSATSEANFTLSALLDFSKSDSGISIPITSIRDDLGQFFARRGDHSSQIPRALCLSREGRRLALISAQGRLYIYKFPAIDSVAGGERLLKRQNDSFQLDELRKASKVAFIDDSRLMIVVQERLFILDLRGNKVIWSKRTHGSISYSLMNRERTRIAVSDEVDKLRVFKIPDFNSKVGIQTVLKRRRVNSK